MRIILLLVVVFFVIESQILKADDILAENHRLRQELTAAKTEFNKMRETNRANQRSIITLRNTIKVIDGEKLIESELSSDLEHKVIYANSFAESLTGFSIRGKDAKVSIVELSGEKVLQLVSTSNDATIQRSITVPEGATLLLSVKIKADNVTKFKSIDYHGTKFMLMLSKDGKTIWPDAGSQSGTFDWTEQQFQVDVPYGVNNVTLVMGIQAATGTVYFKDLKVETKIETLLN